MTTDPTAGVNIQPVKRGQDSAGVDNSAKFQISLQAISRRIVEETRQDAALAVRFRGASSRYGPYHFYCSQTFDKRFGWDVTGTPSDAKAATREALAGLDKADFGVVDLSGRLLTVEVEVIDTPWGVLALFLPARRALGMGALLRVS